MKVFKKTNFKDGDVSALQDNLINVLPPLLATPILDYVEIKEIKLVSGDNTINHLLNRTPQGFIITDINAAVMVYKKQSPIPDKLLVLNSSGDATINLWIY